MYKKIIMIMTKYINKNEKLKVIIEVLNTSGHYLEICKYVLSSY